MTYKRLPYTMILGTLREDQIYPYAVEATAVAKVTFCMHLVNSSRKLFTYTLHLLS